ncbi:transposase [Escherichia coli]|nr:transposase [Escherichia coli]GCP13602.1 transposase [Escherichia coli]
MGKHITALKLLASCLNLVTEPRQPGGCKLKTAPVRPVVAARPAEYVCSEDLFY